MAIKIEEQFQVDAPRDQAWAFFGDPRRVAPCLPGARLTDVVDECTYNGQVRVQVGPVAAQYQGTVTVEARDDVTGTMTMAVRAAQVGAVGRAEGRITCAVRAITPTQTAVEVMAELTVSGRLMQLAGGLIGGVTKQLFQEFVRCARRSILAGQDQQRGDSAAEPDAAAAAGESMNALSLGGQALRAASQNVVDRLRGPR